MATIIPTVFDGKTFVPTEPVDLPVGTAGNVTVPTESTMLSGSTPRSMTPEETREFDELIEQIRSIPPDPPTIEEAMRIIRGRP